MDYFDYYNADYEIYQSIPERINDDNDIEFTELKEMSPQKIYDLEPFLSNNYSYDLNNYPKYNNYTLKISLFIILIIVFIIFIFTHFF